MYLYSALRQTCPQRRLNCSLPLKLEGSVVIAELMQLPNSISSQAGPFSRPTMRSLCCFYKLSVGFAFADNYLFLIRQTKGRVIALAVALLNSIASLWQGGP